jgi:hypothetical protein
MISEYDGALVSSVADRIVSDLARCGTRAVFGVPGGGGNLDLVETAAQHGLPFVLTASETAAALAAMAQAEVTGAPGACLTTLGPGASSVVNGVACAFLDRAPLLVFTDNTSGSITPRCLRRSPSGAHGCRRASRTRGSGGRSPRQWTLRKVPSTSIVPARTKRSQLLRHKLNRCM